MGKGPQSRAIAAITVACIVLAAGIAVAGATQGPDIELPARHADDVVVYNDGRRDLSYTQMQLIPWKDTKGTWHVADGVSLKLGYLSVNGQQQGTIGYSLLDIHRLPLAASHGGTASGTGSTGLMSSEGSIESSTRLESGATFHPCGLVNSLQEGPAKSMKAAGRCLHGDGAKLGHDRLDQWRGDPVHVYAASRAGERVEVWVREDLPYPVKIVTSSYPDRDMEMVALSRGAQALVTPELPIGTPIEPPALQPFLTNPVPLFNGLDYSLRQALADARAGSDRDAIATFEQEHPEAVITSAAAEMAGEATAWNIRLQDAEAGLSISVSRAPSGADPVLVDLGVVSDWSVQTWARESNSGWWLAPEEWLPQIAAHEDVVAAWQTYVDTQDQPTRVGYTSPRCSPGCAPHIYAGAVKSEPMQDPGLLDLQAAPQQSAGEGFIVHAAGSILSIEWVQTSSSRGGGVLSLPSSPEGEATAAPTWSPPSAGNVAAIGAGALLLGAVVWLLTDLSATTLFLRSRQEPEHPVRRQLVELVRTQPGIHYKQIIRITGLGNGTAEHHLRKLVDTGTLQVVRHNRYSCYFPAKAGRSQMAGAGAVKSEGARRVMAAIQANPGAAVTEVAIATGLSPGTVSHHLKRLRDGGQVDAWRDGRSVRLRAVEQVT